MIELHIFTNCTDNILKKRTILETYNSFKQTFGELTPTIWLDPNPNLNDFEYYYNHLKNIFPKSIINVTSSLSDGYIKMIEITNSDYLFVLEHDWIFIKENIKHTLDEICVNMTTHMVSHMRFNKRHNFEKDGDEWICMNPIKYSEVFSKCNGASNNPHIINVVEYKKTALKYLIRDIGSLGIEHNLRNKEDCNFMVYGNMNGLRTIYHLDGRI